MTPIGVIRTPFKEVEGTPIQPSGARGVGGTVEVEPELARDAATLRHMELVRGSRDEGTIYCRRFDDRPGLEPDGRARGSAAQKRH